MTALQQSKPAGNERVLCPTARRDGDGVVVEEVFDELVIYDLERHKTHSLNPTAAAVWRMCDGQTPPEVMAERLSLQAGLPDDHAESLVWLSLAQMEKALLLQTNLQRPPVHGGLTRRQLLARLGIAAALPVIYTLVAPTAAKAVSCGNCPPACSTGQVKCIKAGTTICFCTGSGNCKGVGDTICP